MKLLNNIPKLIVITYFGILAKNILQSILGYLSNSESDIKLYKLYNLQESNYSYGYLIGLIFVYDFLFLAIIFYLPLNLILYLIIIKFGNKIWLQLFYTLGIYLITIYFFDNGDFNYYFIIIALSMGLLNWYLYRKWIKIL
jgi:hypothetical protein